MHMKYYTYPVQTQIPWFIWLPPWGPLENPTLVLYIHIIRHTFPVLLVDLILPVC